MTPWSPGHRSTIHQGTQKKKLAGVVTQSVSLLLNVATDGSTPLYSPMDSDGAATHATEIPSIPPTGEISGESSDHSDQLRGNPMENVRMPTSHCRHPPMRTSFVSSAPSIPAHLSGRARSPLPAAGTGCFPSSYITKPDDVYRTVGC